MWIGGGASEGEKQNAMGYAHVSNHTKKKWNTIHINKIPNP